VKRSRRDESEKFSTLETRLTRSSRVVCRHLRLPVALMYEYGVPPLHILSNLLATVNARIIAATLQEDFYRCNKVEDLAREMSGLRLIQPTELYNLINQETKYPCLSDPVFMLLIGEPVSFFKFERFIL